jgi:hypothetical protein
VSGGYVDQATFQLPEATDTITQAGGGFVQATTAVGHDLVAMMVPLLSTWVEDGPITTVYPEVHVQNTSAWAMEGDDGFQAYQTWRWNFTELTNIAGIEGSNEPAGWSLLSGSSNFDDDVSGRLGPGGDTTFFYDSALASQVNSRTAMETSRSHGYWVKTPVIYDSANRYTMYLKLDIVNAQLNNYAFDGSWTIAANQLVYTAVPSTKYPGWWEVEDAVFNIWWDMAGLTLGNPLTIKPNGDRVNSLADYGYEYQVNVQMFLEYYVPAHQSTGEAFLSAARVGPDDVTKPLAVIARSNLVYAPKWSAAMDMQPVGSDKAIFIYLVGSQSSGVRLDGVALSAANGLDMGPSRTLFDHSLTDNLWDDTYLPESGRNARLARNQNSAVVTPLNSTDVRVTVVVEEFPDVGSDGVSYLADRDFRINPDLSITPLTPGWIKYSRQADPFTITTGRGLYSSQLVDGHVWVADKNRTDLVTFSSQIGVISLGTVAFAQNVHTVVTSGGIVAWLYNWNDVPAIDIFLVGGGTATHYGRIVQDVATGIVFESSSSKPFLSRARVMNQSVWGGWKQNVNLYTTYYGVLFDPKGLALNYGVPHDGDIRSGVGWVTVQQPDRTALGYSAWSTAGYQLKVSRTVFVGVFTEIPPLRLLQRDDGAGLRGHARLQLLGIARRSNSQQTGVRLGIENTYL